MDQSRFQGLVAIQEALSAAKGDLKTVMLAIVNEARVMPQAIGVVVELRDGDQLYYAAASGTSEHLVGLRLALNASLSGSCILSGQPLRCDDVEHDDRVNIEACRKVGLRSMIVVPIPHQGQTIGCLKYYAGTAGAFDEQDMLVGHLAMGPLAVGFSSVAEADATRAQEELKKLLHFKNELVSTVSHELRTPLTAISASLRLLQHGVAGDLPVKAQSLVNLACKNSDRLARLVNDLLDLDKLDGGKMVFNLESLDLRSLLEDAAEQNQPYAANFGVAIGVVVPNSPLFSEVDRHRLLQALTNVLSNACKFSSPGSTVSISLAEKDQRASIVVRDKGAGIPLDFQKRLFERFTQADSGMDAHKQPGTGLGLAITKAIVEQLGGSIALQSSSSAGTAFEILIPLIKKTRLPNQLAA